MIRIEITAETAGEARQQMSDLLGAPMLQPVAGHVLERIRAEGPGPAFIATSDADDDQPVLPLGEALAVAMKDEVALVAPKRERGQPSAGRKRRTKEEIAEDEASDAREAQIAARRADDEQHSRIIEAGRAAVAAEDAKAAISTGEERADPANPEPDVEDDPQDAIDEAEEVEAARDPVKPLTHDDVRALVRDYVAKYGMAAIQKDGPAIFAAALGTPPEGKAGWMVPDIPDDQAVLAVAVKAWAEAVATNPFCREVVAK
jgi:hypothetical protein